MSHRAWLLILPPALAVAALAQDAQRAFRAPQTEFGGRIVTGAPYSAEEVGERIQTLADGTQLAHKMPPVRRYRDAQGRTRTERRSMAPPGAKAADARVFIEISDPVAHVHYVLNTRDKTVNKQRMAPPDSLSAGPSLPPGRTRAATGAARPEMTSESLGSETMEGLFVEGIRQTTTFPVGSKLGNDRPITTVNEVWTSPELKLIVLRKRTDPRNGDDTIKLINISRAEPDPSLFQLPADYTITENQPEGSFH